MTLLPREYDPKFTTKLIIRDKENTPTFSSKTKKEDIDMILDFPEEEEIALLGLNQETFEYFVDTYGAQFKRIYLQSCKFISDLSPLSKIPNLEYLYIFHNQRVEKLWDMSHNLQLHTLIISDFSRLKTLSNIETAKNLKVFWRGDAIWVTAECDTLAPLQYSSIEILGFHFKKIEDDDLTPIIKMKNLKAFYCHPNQFDLTQCVDFSIKRPEVVGNISTPYVQWGKDHILVVGKRGRLLTEPVSDDVKTKHTNRWNSLKRV